MSVAIGEPENGSLREITEQNPRETGGARSVGSYSLATLSYRRDIWPASFLRLGLL